MESAKILALVERGYLRHIDIAAFFSCEPAASQTRSPGAREDGGQAQALATPRRGAMAKRETPGVGSGRGGCSLEIV